MFFYAETTAAKDCEGIGGEGRGEKKKVGVGEAAVSVPHWKGAISNVLIVEGVKCLRGQRRWMAWFGHSTLDSSHCSSVCLVNIYSDNISHLTSGFKDANLRKTQTPSLRNSIHPHAFSVLSQGEIILQAETPTWFFHKVLQWQKIPEINQTQWHQTVIPGPRRWSRRFGSSRTALGMWCLWSCRPVD